MSAPNSALALESNAERVFRQIPARSADKIVAIGLRSAPPAVPSLENSVADSTDAICRAITSSIAASLSRIRHAEQHAIARLNAYVPTEPLMDSKQAAAYLKMPLRTLQLLTAPKNPTLPFTWVGGLKRFRKTSLDAWLDEHEVKTPRIRLR